MKKAAVAVGPSASVCAVCVGIPPPLSYSGGSQMGLVSVVKYTFVLDAASDEEARTAYFMGSRHMCGLEASSDHTNATCTRGECT